MRDGYFNVCRACSRKESRARANLWYKNATPAERSARYIEQKNQPGFMERKRQNNRKTAKKHRDKWNHWHRAYLARKNGAPGFASEKQVQWRLQYYAGRCWMCGDIGTAIDHVIPLSRGGTNWPANLRRRANLVTRRRVIVGYQQKTGA